MDQPHIIDIDYYVFLEILKHATISKKKIEKTDKERWQSFVRKHKIPEAGIGVHAKAGAISGKTKTVIIEGTGATDGYYVYSNDDMFCLKYEQDLD